MTPRLASSGEAARSSPARRLVLYAELSGVKVEVVVDAVPEQDGEVYVRFTPGEPPVTVAARTLQLTGIAPTSSSMDGR